MKFSTQNLLSIREWQSHAEVYQNTLEECRLADELGFDTVWLAEHHFSPYGICPSLAPLAGALARETRRGRNRPAGRDAAPPAPPPHHRRGGGGRHPLPR